HYTGIHRETKDLDLFLLREDADRAVDLLDQAGYRTERGVHGWLHKAFWRDFLIDLIYASGNGITVVDPEWLAHGQPAEILGQPCRVVAPEEILWSKAFVLERDRFDGAEINHLILRTGDRLDWERLLARFEPYWE